MDASFAPRSEVAANRKARLAFAFVLALAALAGLLWYALALQGYTTYQIHTRDPVSGLIVDAPIEFHGVDVGRVTKIELVDPQSVRILLSIRDGAPVTTATVATITSRGLATRGVTGYVDVSLEDSGDDRKPVVAQSGADYPVIPTAPSRSVNLDLAIDEVNRNVQFITQTLQATLDPKTIASLKQSADNLQRVSKVLETQVLPEAHKTLSRVEELSTSMSGVAAKLNRDPSVIVRGPERRPLGPGEKK